MHNDLHRSPDAADAGSGPDVRSDRSWLNILAAGTGLASLVLPVVGVAAAVGAIALGLMGVQASRRGVARFAGAGVAGVVLGCMSLVVLLWLAASWSDGLAEFD